MLGGHFALLPTANGRIIVGSGSQRGRQRRLITWLWFKALSSSDSGCNSFSSSCFWPMLPLGACPVPWNTNLIGPCKHSSTVWAIAPSEKQAWRTAWLSRPQGSLLEASQVSQWLCQLFKVLCVFMKRVKTFCKLRSPDAVCPGN